MKWVTTYTLAWCAGSACEWARRAEDQDPPSAHAAAVRAGVDHERVTGHLVTYERGQRGLPKR